MRRISKKILLTVAVIVVASITAIFVWRSINSPASLTKVKGYRQGVPCDAISPVCGYCPGEVIDKECYVDLKKLTPEERGYIGLD